VAATERAALRQGSSLASASKSIETWFPCTNVPKPSLTVGEVLAALKAAAVTAGDARAIRRALLEVLAGLDEAE
jgi:hypothetical protein